MKSILDIGYPEVYREPNEDEFRPEDIKPFYPGKIFKYKGRMVYVELVDYYQNHMTENG